MIDCLTPYSIASSIKLLRDIHTGAVAVFEGDSDIRLFSKFLDEAACVPINAYNKDNALKVIAILEEEGIPGVLAIVDADYWRVDGLGPPSPNVFATDEHDLEATIFRSPALDDMLTEFGSRTKIALYTARTAASVGDTILAIAVPIGFLRWASSLSGLNLRFEGLVFARFVQLRIPLALDRARFIRAVLDNSQRHDLSMKQIDEHISGREKSGADPWQVVCGHDLCCVLSLALRSLLGTKNANEVCVDLVELSLRLAYQQPHFRVTSLYHSIERWQVATGYRVFPEQ